MTLNERLQAIDGFQQRHRGLSLAAVIKKFGDDGSGRLAALIAYYGFFALFPLLLVFVTVLGFALEGNKGGPGERAALHLSQFPIIGNQLERNVHSLTDSGVGLAPDETCLLSSGVETSQRRHETESDSPRFLRFKPLLLRVLSREHIERLGHRQLFA